MSEIHCRIITPHGIYKEFDTTILNVVTKDGQRGILPEHMPLVTMLEIGQLESVEKGEREQYAIAGGLLYFRDNTADILTDGIENKNDIDVERACKAMERAEKRINSNDPDMDLVRAEIALKKALNRLKVSGNR